MVACTRGFDLACCKVFLQAKQASAVNISHLQCTPMIYTVSFIDKMLELKLKIYGKLYNCLAQTNELD